MRKKNHISWSIPIISLGCFLSMINSGSAMFWEDVAQKKIDEAAKLKVQQQRERELTDSGIQGSESSALSRGDLASGNGAAEPPLEPFDQDKAINIIISSYFISLTQEEKERLVASVHDDLWAEEEGLRQCKSAFTREAKIFSIASTIAQQAGVLPPATIAQAFTDYQQAAAVFEPGISRTDCLKPDPAESSNSYPSLHAEKLHLIFRRMENISGIPASGVLRLRGGMDHEEGAQDHEKHIRFETTAAEQAQTNWRAKIREAIAARNATKKQASAEAENAAQAKNKWKQKAIVILKDVCGADGDTIDQLKLLAQNYRSAAEEAMQAENVWKRRAKRAEQDGLSKLRGLEKWNAIKEWATEEPQNRRSRFENFVRENFIQERELERDFGSTDELWRKVANQELLKNKARRTEEAAKIFSEQAEQVHQQATEELFIKQAEKTNLARISKAFKVASRLVAVGDNLPLSPSGAFQFFEVAFDIVDRRIKKSEYWEAKSVSKKARRAYSDAQVQSENTRRAFEAERSEAQSSEDATRISNLEIAMAVARALRLPFLNTAPHLNGAAPWKNIAKLVGREGNTTWLTRLAQQVEIDPTQTVEVVTNLLKAKELRSREAAGLSNQNERSNIAQLNEQSEDLRRSALALRNTATIKKSEEEELESAFLLKVQELERAVNSLEEFTNRPAVDLPTPEECTRTREEMNQRIATVARELREVQGRLAEAKSLASQAETNALNAEQTHETFHQEAVYGIEQSNRRILRTQAQSLADLLALKIFQKDDWVPEILPAITESHWSDLSKASRHILQGALAGEKDYWQERVREIENRPPLQVAPQNEAPVAVGEVPPAEIAAVVALLNEVAIEERGINTLKEQMAFHEHTAHDSIKRATKAASRGCWDEAIALRQAARNAYGEIIDIYESARQIDPRLPRLAQHADIYNAKRKQVALALWYKANKAEGLATTLNNNALASEATIDWERAIEGRKQATQAWDLTLIALSDGLNQIANDSTEKEWWNARIAIAKNAKNKQKALGLWHVANKADQEADQSDRAAIAAATGDEQPALWTRAHQLREAASNKWEETIACLTAGHDALPENSRKWWKAEIETAKNAKNKQSALAYWHLANIADSEAIIKGTAAAMTPSLDNSERWDSVIQSNTDAEKAWETAINSLCEKWSELPEHRTDLTQWWQTKIAIAENAKNKQSALALHHTAEKMVNIAEITAAKTNTTFITEEAKRVYDSVITKYAESLRMVISAGCDYLKQDWETDMETIQDAKNKLTYKMLLHAAKKDENSADEASRNNRPVEESNLKRINAERSWVLVCTACKESLAKVPEHRADLKEWWNTQLQKAKVRVERQTNLINV